MIVLQPSVRREAMGTCMHAVMHAACDSRNLGPKLPYIPLVFQTRKCMVNGAMKNRCGDCDGDRQSANEPVNEVCLLSGADTGGYAKCD